MAGAEGKEKSKRTQKINIRFLVEEVFKGGSLAAMAPDFVSAVEGTRIHRKYQQRDIAGYEAEVQLEQVFSAEYIDLLVSGKADGIYTSSDGTAHIEEIKTLSDLTAIDQGGGISVHWAQLKMYGWFYCLQNGSDSLVLDLIYYRRTDGQERIFSTDITLEELEAQCRPWVDQILAWQNRIEEKRVRVAGQLCAMPFPFADFRPGQRDFSKTVYRGIRDGKAVFLQAATGTGKTMAAIFPAVRALGEGLCDKVFFLTAKNSGANAAENALIRINGQGAGLSWISITAKARICFMLDEDNGEDRPPCDPERCPYARGYFDRIDAALEELFAEQAFTRDKIGELARRHMVCPFEYSLDLSVFCDVVIGDCNYAFDYGASLKRFFRQGKVPYVLLIDEAHNLVDRARSMFSCTVDKQEILKLRRACADSEKKLADRLNSFLLGLRKQHGQWMEQAFPDYPEKLDRQVNTLLDRFDRLMQNGRRLSNATADLYWYMINVKLVLEQYDDSYRTIIKTGKTNVEIALLCIDPSRQIEAVLKNQQASVFFSATLQPFEYYVALLAPARETVCSESAAWFPPENVLHIINNRVSTRWKMREAHLLHYRDIADRFVRNVRGNMIIFSPSFSFQEELLGQLADEKNGETVYPANFLVQQRKMNLEQKQAFLEALSDPAGNITGFCVIGGSFAESIDLPGERLVGVVIFGVGLPQVNVYTRTVKEYFDTHSADGYLYAYVYPGISKVLQAAGRVIRSDDDRGFIYLVDDRYGSGLYRELLPGSWLPEYEKCADDTLSRINRLLVSKTTK
ncbi:MAG: ATP-dependent DNA helicase [Spirochaetales bacterium]|nr:ATP-dependent DNA helicase [Spirochaetales bacterium]